MHVVRQTKLGGPEVLELAEVPRPCPGPTEVLVRVRAAGVNPVDWKTRERGGFLGEPPFVLGWDVCGQVVSLGLGATPLTVGDDVLGLVRFPGEAGAYGEYVTAPSRQLVRRPPELGHLAAAALPLAGLTAWQALVDVASVQPGQRVLIHAAAGGVGHLAAQIAAARGALVYGTARPHKHDFLRSVGVARPLDYTSPDWSRAVGDLDMVLDPFGGDAAVQALRLLRPGGVLVTLRSAVDPRLAEAADRLGVRSVVLVVEPDRVGLSGLIGLVQAGRLRVHVDRVYRLEEAAAAHEAGQSGRTTGKIVLAMA
jgi:NADPH:quinone reductase-like Zn-dependent oxidoreductase